MICLIPCRVRKITIRIVGAALNGCSPRWQAYRQTNVIRTKPMHDMHGIFLCTFFHVASHPVPAPRNRYRICSKPETECSP